MPNTEPSIAVDALRKKFGATTALDGIDLSVDGAGILGVAGPNGSGKTTLIHCLLGLVSPTAGEACIAGTPPQSFDADDRRRIGYMPQHTAVYDDLTVRENVAFFARLYGVDDRATAIDRALSFVDLADRADSRIGELSGGMIRRTSLACALVHDPDVLFLDEPTVGLDPKLRASMWEGFRQRRDNGALVVVSTHYLDEVKHCDRVLFLREGRVLTVDSPDGVLDATGTDELEAAFLTLLDDEGATPSDKSTPSATDSTNGGAGS
ncbi:MAG: ABC transporter ATP-binding protein [Halobacteriaceae archaeon]